MNVYDKAYDLKCALMECPEVKEYKYAFEKIKANPTNNKMVDDFREKQMELQSEQLLGKEPSKDKIEELQKIYNVISTNTEINTFLQCEYKFSMLMNDLTKIVSEAVDIDFD